MSELIDTTQMYLRTIYELLESGVEPRRARIVERLHQAGPTVSQTVARMERDGLLGLSHGRTIELSDTGYNEGRAVMRRHRLAECFFVNGLGMDYASAHDEACRWEHVMSEEVANRLCEMLGTPVSTPYGTPIPHPDAPEASSLEDYGVDLLEAEQKGLGKARFVLIDEYAQSDMDFLEAVDAAGIHPGATVDLSRDGEDYVVASEGGKALHVPEKYAPSLRVSAL
ncbi:metal-dependent transcriptional regulator [Propionibacterium freudenreichii]|uniref:metal-dependent transcriptional regulator n=1 Tax=Propionibacterium freudenreichii TaxID=1744 RepID=UPI0021A7E610|nr:metal-dependent transcriptional regulator [Propionibacterium freudenreichii]MCT2974778.1 metal-dependent transcriptional regulator [Propionibacterium freudenreichii]